MPPGQAARGDRREVFSAALQQAEELHRASESSGCASKPLPLFYALSQAGRAIVAAKEPSSEWRPIGHGLKVSVRDPIGATLITPTQSKGSSFQAMARALDDRPPGDVVTLSRVWAAIPGLEVAPGLGDQEQRPLALQPYPGGEDTHYFLVEGPANEADEQMVRREYAVFPRLRSAQLWSYVDTATEQRAWVPGWTVDVLDHAAPRYPGNNRVLIPCLKDGEDPPSLLLLWWMVLIALSSIARYEPERWSKAINVDESETAVPLENGLRAAEGHVPGLILEALR